MRRIKKLTRHRKEVLLHVEPEILQYETLHKDMCKIKDSAFIDISEDSTRLFIRYQKFQAIQYLTNKDHSALFDYNKALILAVRQNKFQCLNFLISCGQYSKDDLSKALKIAIGTERLDRKVISYLIELGATITLQKQHAIHWVFGVDVNALEYIIGKECLYVENCKNDAEEEKKSIIQNGVNNFKQQNIGINSSHDERYVRILEYLLGQGADINLNCKEMLKLEYYGRYAVISYLIDQGSIIPEFKDENKVPCHQVFKENKGLSLYHIIEKIMRKIVLCSSSNRTKYAQQLNQLIINYPSASRIIKENIKTIASK